MWLHNWLSTSLQQLLKARRKKRGGGRSCSSSDEREHTLVSCAGCDLDLPCTVPQGYCRAFTILFPIFTSSVLPTTANGKWLCEAEEKKNIFTLLNTPEGDFLQIHATNHHLSHFITKIKTKSITAMTSFIHEE